MPQEPFLLEGTLKANLDPLNFCSDNEIDEVLKSVKYKSKYCLKSNKY